ncbi:MAG TPA: cupin domain-containing protein [Acidimicrobiales bacterium]|nr:cupin domain-containing protein [Acidimicrobiales bacterium]
MPQTPILASRARRTETPNALMTTLASPTQGGTASLSMWLVDMRAGQQGPLHIFDVEQIWHVLQGQVDIAVDAEHAVLGPGDTLVLAAGARRQVSALADARLVVCGRADAAASVPGEATSRGAPPWIS